MKLYSRQQLALGIVAGALGASALVFGSVFILARNSRTEEPAVMAGQQSQPLTSVRTETTQFPLKATQVVLGADAGYSADESENIGVYEKYNESVVNITTEVVKVDWFLDPVPQSGGSGSGSIIDTRGYILTNYHVVKDTYKLFVNLADGSQYPAEVKGADPQNDLAIIKFTPPANLKLRPIPFGSSKNLKVGQKVLAIGNPFGLERTLTLGIISGLGRPIQEDETTILQNMIQTDASINPGNSGGPLFNARGEMIGINTMIYSPSGGSVGIGFAIPVDTAVRIVPELISQGKVRRGWIDVEAVQLFPALVEYLKQNGYGAPMEKGLLISTVKQGSLAEKAGIKGGTTNVRYGRSTFKIGGDILAKVDGMDIGSIADLYTALEDNKPGEKIVVEFYRGKQIQRITLTLSESGQEDQ
ncbi:MAG: trypsin-like peptidase domain-containing protein [Spirochaetes bacterium]|nr:trypsin-like peptidase domain-containing protein [Spirochaetota bacterium]